MSRVNISLVCVCLCFHIATVLSQFGFFPRREDRRQPLDFVQNFIQNPKRITETLSGILHFQPGNKDRNPYVYPFGVPGISNNEPNYNQNGPNYPNEFRDPNYVRFPNRGGEIPNDGVNFERPYNPYENTRPGNPGFNNGFNPGNNFNGFRPGNNENSGLVPGNNENNRPVVGNNENNGLVSGIYDNGNNENGGLISGNNDRPVFNNDDNSGLVSGNVNGPPPFGNDNNGGLISGSVNGPPPFGNDNNGGLISGSVNGPPPFGNENNDGLISDNNENEGHVSGNTYNDRPVFASDNDEPVSVNDGMTEAPSPVMVVEDAVNTNVPVFNDRNFETDETDVNPLPSLTPAPASEGKNLVFETQGLFSNDKFIYGINNNGTLTM